jgi:F420-non-reducing hydrogenase iron-sulfur subunit
MKAEKMFKMTLELVKMLGIDPDRLRLQWVSSAEGLRFAEAVQEFTEKIKSIGPSDVKVAA